ncbi:MAG TPA: Hsp20/alpha crystallin family protein, partial [Terriglobales bacterium]|nr:Hsp20/alpha crystallin family protein [Terriglobales bacterium]
ELQVSVEPRRVTILGKKEMSMTESEGGKIEYVDWYPDQLLQFIDLPGEVAPDRSTVELQAGLLRCELPRAAAEKIATTGIAA